MIPTLVYSPGTCPVPPYTGLCPCQSQSSTFPWERTPFCVLNFHSTCPTSPPYFAPCLIRRVRSFLCLTWSVLGKARLNVLTKAVHRPKTQPCPNLEQLESKKDAGLVVCSSDMRGFWLEESYIIQMGGKVRKSWVTNTYGVRLYHIEHLNECPPELNRSIHY